MTTNPGKLRADAIEASRGAMRRQWEAELFVIHEVTQAHGWPEGDLAIWRLSRRREVCVP